MQSAYATNRTSTEIAIYMFRHSMGVTSSGSQDEWLERCFRNGPLYGSTFTHKHTYQIIIYINIFK